MLPVCKEDKMRKTKGGKTSTTVKDRYNRKTYNQINIRVKINEYPTKEDIEKAAQEDNVSLNAWIVDAILSKLSGNAIIDVPDVAAYARSAGMTEEEYIKSAVLEKMQRQDEAFKEEVIREHFNG